jgi:four helix bundle protein
MARTYRELIVGQRAKQLTIMVYRETESFPAVERYGLRSQIRRCAVSVPCNIAEGQGRLTKGEFRQFLGQARGSILELETQLVIAFELGYIPESSHRSLETHTFQVLGLLNRLIESISPRGTMKP